MAPKKAAGARKGKAKAAGPKASQHKISKPSSRAARAASPAAATRSTRKAAAKATAAISAATKPAASKAPAAKAPAAKASASKVIAAKPKASKATTSNAKASKGTATKAQASKAKVSKPTATKAKVSKAAAPKIRAPRAAAFKATTSKAAAPKATAPKKVKYTREDNFQTRNNEQFILTTTAEVQNYLEYDSCKRIDTFFQLKQGKGKRFRVGRLVAWIVDRSVTDPEGTPLWIFEFLEQNEVTDHDDTLELRQVIRLLYNEDGTPTEVVDFHQRELSQNEIVFIDTFELKDDYRRTGLARRALDDFQDIVQKDLHVRTIVLSPARAAGANWHDFDDVQVEDILITVYERNGYNLWIRGQADGGISVMGQDLEADEDDEDEE